MRRIHVALVLVLIGGSAACNTQATAQKTDPAFFPARFDVSIGYNYIKANAPPGGCECFALNGGYASTSFRLRNWLSAEGEFTAAHGNDISTLGQDLTLKTFAGGPRVLLPMGRFVPYAQALFGVAHGSDSYFPTGRTYTTSATSFDINAGGGLDVNLTRRVALRAVQAQYMRTTFPNGSTNEQSQLELSAGIIFKFGVKPSPVPLPPAPLPPPPPRNDLAFSCSTNVVNIEQGQILEVLGNTVTEPDHLAVSYTWTTTGGRVQGAGREITVDTEGLPVGRYRVTGHVVAVNDTAISALCDVAFRVVGHPAPALKEDKNWAHDNAVKQDKVFHENVQDAFFDYDKWNIRPDAQQSIERAAAFLKEHQEIDVLIGGYSDERGTTEYNLSLGLKRAEATRKALIAAGVDAGRLQVISYGKGTQVCTAENEKCWQQNRRAAFAMHP